MGWSRPSAILSIGFGVVFCDFFLYRCGRYWRRRPTGCASATRSCSSNRPFPRCLAPNWTSPTASKGCSATSRNQNTDKLSLRFALLFLRFQGYFFERKETTTPRSEVLTCGRWEENEAIKSGWTGSQSASSSSGGCIKPPAASTPLKSNPTTIGEWKI